MRKAARAVQLADQREHLVGQTRAQAQRRLVEHHELRRGQQPAPDRQHLLLAARQHRSKRIPPRREVRKARIDFGDFGVDRTHILARKRAHQQIFVHREARHDAAALRHQREMLPHPPARRPARDVGAVEHDAALRRRLQSHQRLEQRRLARAVGAEHRHHLALFHRQRDAAHRMDAPIANVKIVHLKTHDRCSAASVPR